LHGGKRRVVGHQLVAHQPFDRRRSRRRCEPKYQVVARVNHLVTIAGPTIPDILASSRGIAAKSCMGGSLPTLDKVSIDITVVLGTSSMPIHQVLRLGRGAIIELDASEEDEVRILANNMPVAKGTVVVSGNRIAIEVKQLLPRTPVGA
jgi:flagellar motor switch protein FliN